ncbi:hypothetical protein [Dactylosporangium sp. NPDC051541]|uniref:hypothetical protein n=1 Tax=Dactylosporangium sp. NPDC051541 TaxID=3363977 RepID=UPI0037A90C4B
MSKRLPAQRPPVRYVAYPDVARRTPGQDQELLQLLAAQAVSNGAVNIEIAATVQRRVQAMERRDQEQRAAYQRWLLRRAEIDRQDRRTQMLLLGGGAVVAAAVLGGAGFVLYLVAHAAASLALGVLGAVVAVVLLGAAVTGVGRRCITVVNHWHE